MKYLAGLAIVLGTCMISSSCIKHEVVPAPTPKVDLPASFSALLDGNNYELINDVDGYFCKPDQAQEIYPSPQPSTVTYYSSIMSKEKLEFVKIEVGQLNFNAGSSTLPTLESFKTYFEGLTTVNYSTDAIDGVQIIYGDANGGLWYSDENMPNQSFEFTSVRQESDEDGDYMIFTANFSASLVDDIGNPTDTIQFDNAVFKGYFKRQL